jgi:hypothetical protein
MASIIALAWVMATPPEPDPRMARLEAELREARQTITQLRRDLANRPASVPAASGSSSGTVAVGNASDGAAGAGATGTAGASGGVNGALREMMKNPAMRDLLLQQQAVQIEAGYARLFEYLQLTDEEKAHFKKLLVERAGIEADLSMKLLDPNLSPAERQRLIAEAEKNYGAFNQSIKGFLNNDSDWSTFERWEGTKRERTAFETMGRSIFNASGEPLSTQQEDQLMTLMAQLRQTPSQEQAELQRVVQNGGKLDAAGLNRLLEQQRVMDEQTRQQAAAFLTPTQLKALTNFQEQILTNAKAAQEAAGVISNSR